VLFTEPLFLIFFAVVFCGHWVVRHNGFRKIWLLVASYVFYAGWDWRFLFLIFASTAIDFVVGLALSKEKPFAGRRLWLIVSLCGNLGILGFFKYFNFFVESVQGVLTLLGLDPGERTLNIILPVGISFFTFQTMSYTIEIYRGKLAAIKNPLDFALFVGFFPQLVAGPIVRAADFLPQLTKKRRFSDIPFRLCLQLFLYGYIKKAIVSDSLAPLIDAVFSSPEAYSWVGVWIAALFFSIQVYCDFSGYTDMAIATANLLGFRLMKNFDFPFFAPNVSDFWRRWHISLSSWLRDYVYISFGGSRGSNLFIYRNVFLTMLLGGLWHGAAWTFVVWGGMHGVAIIVHREFQRIISKVEARPFGDKFLGALMTFLWFTFTMTFFRAESFGDAIGMARSFTFFVSAGTETLDARLLWWIVPMFLVDWVVYKQYLRGLLERIPDWLFAAGYATAIVLLLPFVPVEYKPFIYFQF